jgi:hypothetical protein
VIIPLVNELMIGTGDVVSVWFNIIPAGRLATDVVTFLVSIFILVVEVVATTTSVVVAAGIVTAVVVELSVSV